MQGGERAKRNDVRAPGRGAGAPAAAAPAVTSAEHQFVEAFAEWARRHPEPELPIYRRGRLLLTAEEMVGEMRRRTPIGVEEIARAIAIREREGAAAFAAFIASFDAGDMPAVGARSTRAHQDAERWDAYWRSGVS